MNHILESPASLCLFTMCLCVRVLLEQPYCLAVSQLNLGDLYLHCSAFPELVQPSRWVMLREWNRRPDLRATEHRWPWCAPRQACTHLPSQHLLGNVDGESCGSLPALHTPDPFTFCRHHFKDVPARLSWHFTESCLVKMGCFSKMLNVSHTTLLQHSHHCMKPHWASQLLHHCCGCCCFVGELFNAEIPPAEGSRRCNVRRNTLTFYIQV